MKHLRKVFLENIGALRRFMRLVGIIAALALSGCQASFRGAPEPSIDPNRDLLKSAVEASLSDENINAALTNAGTPEQQVARRNTIVFGRMAELDRLYYEYERNLSSEVRKSDLGTSLVALAAGVAGTLAGTEAASQAFSAVNAIVAGTQAAFNETILVDQTIQALASTMRANRDNVKAQTYKKLNKDTASYPLIAAVADLELYRQAGTLPGALLGISEAASDAEVRARGKAETAAREIKVVTTTEGDRVLNLSGTAVNQRNQLRLALGDSDLVPDSKILALANNPPTKPAAFETRFAPLRPQSGTFTDADVKFAREALKIGVDGLDSQDDLKAWQDKINE